MKTKHSIKSVLSGFLAAVMMIGTIPTTGVLAAQSNEYIDPADVWLETNSRTSEFDANATVTSGTQHCLVCNKDTISTSYRVPEYTRSGTTALNRGVYYSDGTLLDGEGKGNLDSGRPGVDAYYTGYHWSATRS